MTISRAFLAVLFACVAIRAHAGEQVGGANVIRYNALATSNLPAASAQRYGLTRAEDQGIVIVAVARGSDDGDVPATVEGRAMTLIGAPVPIAFRRVEDAGTVSWLGTFRIPSPGALHFVLTVTPRGSATETVDFTQDF
ncbi:uncharacterized protein DUF4426 [Luteibacter rhizovicinus]|uniref:Uncharacterized protein DUF4426 n=1 Tax=Luteibacter rhizovicinus TaxID=242606 RepID=A0A4V2W414_9GAMM|nr:DUF4426 domain-containing protein [Luteibacter rhizovicinus]TCV94189.1 uncharacterized protein DUF4426 [Luteibacter rhizovicinus]